VKRHATRTPIRRTRPRPAEPNLDARGAISYAVLVVVVSTAIVVVSAALAPARRAARVDVGMLLRLE